MQPIPFPGDTRPDQVRNLTVPLNEEVDLTFSEPGYFSHTSDDAFIPNLPTGYFYAESSYVSGPALKLGQTISLYFLDDLDPKNRRLITVTLTVVDPSVVPLKKKK